MAGAGYKLFNTGDVLTAQQVNEYLMQQTVMVFADASARTTALSGVLAEGMISYLKDTNATEYYTGSAWVGVGSDLPTQTGNSGKYLTTDGTSASWATVSAGGMTLISETVASANSSLSLSSIPSTYKDLLITWNGIYHSASGNRFNIRLNNDSGANYSMKYIYQSVGALYIGGGDGGTSVIDGSSFAPFGRDATSSTYNETAEGFLIIENYASTSKYKNYRGEWRFQEVGTGAFSLWNLLGTYKSTSAVSSIDVVRVVGTGTFSNASNTSIRLYGVS